MAVTQPAGAGWIMSIVPVGDLATLFTRLRTLAGAAAVVLGVDFPIGLPRAYVERHPPLEADFPAFLQGLATRPAFFDVASAVDQIAPGRPFYPRIGVRGMTRLAHAQALGLASAQDLCRACDRATLQRPAGAPLFWTLGANQSGKSAISAWRDLLLPAFGAGLPLSIWPFDGPLRALARPGTIVVAETYPADAMRQIGLRPIGSKRRHADRLSLVPGIRSVMDGIGVGTDDAATALLANGFGADAAGEDRMDCVLGVLCVLMVLAGRRPDRPPPDPWLTCWEGWVLGQGA